MQKYFKSILPSVGLFLSFFIAPIVFGIFFIVTRYADQFIQTQGLDYYAIQNNVLALFFINGSLNELFTRFMDFAFWGVLASIVLLIIWGLSVARISLQNHTTEEQFVNFRASKQSWHGHFVVVAAMKAVLIFVMVYSVLSFIARAIPQLAVGIADSVKALSVDSFMAVSFGILLMLLFQFLFVIAFKTFKHTHAE